nr:MAG TPA_asm: hypothetical protein [Caudoviricetes sp.]
MFYDTISGYVGVSAVQKTFRKLIPSNRQTPTIGL